ncbi:MAG: type II toxin-antitoxin system RelE/ParE family toxin [Planctomycetota bacterium]
MPEIRLTESAVDDLYEIWNYIAIEQCSPQAADGILDAINEKVLLALSHPGVGQQVDHLRPDTRRLVVKRRFLVFYQNEEDGLLVLRVLHGARLISKSDFERLR